MAWQQVLQGSASPRRCGTPTCMAGRKRSTAFKLTSAKHNVRGLIVPQGAAGALQLRSRYVLAGGSAVVGLLLGVWAVTALHRLHTRVDQATLQHSGFASAAVRDSHPQADALIQMHEAAATTTHQQHTTTDSLGVAAAVAAAAGALAAEGPEEAAGGAGQEQLRPHHQQQTQQVQVQVTVTHVEPEDQAVRLTHTNSNSAKLPHQQQQQLQQQQVDQEAHDHTKPSSLPEHTVQESVVSWNKVEKKNAEGHASRHAGSQQGPAASHPKSSSSQQHPGPPPKVALLFLVKDRLANEAVWRAFFQAASQLQLQPAVAAAAAKAVQANTKTTVSDAVGAGRSLHPDVGSFPAWAYPGYRVQHGLTPGADPPPAKPTPQAAAAAGAAGGQRVAAAESSGSSSSTATFPAAAYPWEAALLQSSIRELAAVRAQAGQEAPTQTRQQQQQDVLSQQQQKPWSPYQQLSTLREALAASAVAAGASSAAQPNTTGPTAPSTARSNSSSTDSRTPPSTPQRQRQDQQVLVDQQRCLASLASPAAAHNPVTGPGLQQQQQQQQQQQHQQQQQLFSVYVHSPAGVLLPPDSVLSGCELAVRLNTTRAYAQHVLAEAAALLLHAALSDPLNTKFVLVSDTSLPLYPPQVIWSQLLFEPLSRVDACITPGRDTQLSSRWRSVMATKHFGPQHWRKSSQWFTLSRPHALLAVADLHVREMLHRYCYTNLTRMYPICVSDEHWLPSLLASYNLDSQTDCEGASHYADWSAGGWHPKTFTAADLTPALVTLMRTGVPSKVAQLAALQQQQQHSTTVNPAAGAGSTDHDALGGHQVHPRALLDVEGGLTVTPAALTPNSPVLQQAATGAGLQAAADSRSIAISMLQARARVAAAAMAAAAAECDSGRAMTIATHLVFKPRQSLVGYVEQSRQEQQQQHQHPSQQSAQQLAGADADGLAGSLPTNGSSEEPHWLLSAGYEPLNQRCPLFARKFPEVDEVLPIALSCAGLQLGSWCHT